MEAGSSGKSGAKPGDRSAAKPSAAKPAASAAKRRMLLRGGVVALALLAGLIAWLATRDGGGGGTSAPAEAAPRIVSAGELSEAAASSGNPVYWASEMPGTEIELTELPEGAQVRYVPEGTEAGGGSAAVLTVSSYPLPDPSASLEDFANRSGAIVRQASDGREIVSSAERPTSVYFVSPDNSVQVEVYDPSPRRAMSLALSGRVQPAP